MKLKCEEHLFTSSKKGFSTVYISESIPKEEKRVLEDYSVYILPPELLYKDDVKTPVKYVFYPLGQKKIVVGPEIISFIIIFSLKKILMPVAEIRFLWYGFLKRKTYFKKVFLKIKKEPKKSILIIHPNSNF